MEKRRKGIDRTLWELALGIGCWGVVCEAAAVWLVSDKAGYSIGLWLGVLLAEASGIHMWWSLDRALDLAEDLAVKMVMKQNILRYAVIVEAMAAVMLSGFANPLAVFLGLMGLKTAAYLQPFTHKICVRFYKEKV